MTTIKLIWAMVFDRAYDANPIAQQEWLRSARNPLIGRRAQFAYALVVSFLIIVAFVTAVHAPDFLRNFPVFANIIVNLLWTVPVSGVVAHAIQRERTRQTLQVLLVTPYTTSAILVAKAVGGFARINKIVLSGLLTLSWFGMVGNVFLILLAGYSSQNTLFWVLFAVFGIGLLFWERMQELALSASIGLYLGSIAPSKDFVGMMLFILNFAVRVVQLLVLVTFIDTSTSVTRELSTLGWLNLLMGSSAALVYAPSLANLGLILIMFGVREALIAGLFRVTLRQTLRTVR